MLSDVLLFKAVDKDFMGCYLVLDGEETLIATILGPCTLNIPIREAFIKLCQSIVDDMASKPINWNKTRYDKHSRSLS